MVASVENAFAWSNWPYGQFDGRANKALTCHSRQRKNQEVTGTLSEGFSEPFRSTDTYFTGNLCRFRRSMQHFSSRMTYQAFSEVPISRLY